MKNATIYLLGFLVGFSNLASSQTTDKLPCIDKKFSIVVHIVRDSLHVPSFTTASILADVQTLNTQFVPICVSFEVCLFDTIDNFSYDNLDTTKHQWSELQILYNVKNRINIYYVKTIVKPAGACGFATLGGITEFTAGGIVLGCGGGRTLEHEMGHYFGLYHTFFNDNELVNESNCTTAGDSICDTPADPFVYGDNPANYVNASCQFISMDKDANGQYYSPIVGNIMNYYPATCQCNPGFTHDQYKKMAKTYLSKIGMW